MNIKDPLSISYGGANYFGLNAEGLIAAGVPASAVLDAVKGRLKSDVDSQAEAIRLGLVTPGAGQALEYQQAQIEAVDVLAASGSVDPNAYPMLAAGVGVDIDPDTGLPAADVYGAARSVRAAFGAWLAAGAAIRKARLAGKAAIEAADTVEDAIAARDAIAWPAN